MKLTTLLPALGLLSLTATSCVHAADNQTPENYTADYVLKVNYSYLLSLPDGYEADKDKKWPLIVFLHGAGERGTNLELLKKHGPPKLIAAGQKFPAIVVSPQVLPKQIWNPHGVKALTDSIVSKYRVDARRVYLTGISMGGFGTWETGMEYPETYAALVPICGGAGVRFVMAERIKDKPVWIFHGAKDPVVEPAYSQRMFDVLTKLKAPVKLTMYPDLMHDSWTRAYEDPELWKWVFEQKQE